MSAEERVIFDAVVRPQRVKSDGNAQVEIERLRKEVARSEKMLANERFVANAAPEVVEGEREKLAHYERELRALEG
jgi:valyl-tRNA synthetase